MSMNQTRHLFETYTRPKGVLQNGEPIPTYCFMYDRYCNHRLFQQRYPRAIYLCTAFLEKWQWHINENLQPNIRKPFHDPGLQKAVVMPSPSTVDEVYQHSPHPPGTWGYLFKIPSEVEAELDKEYCQTHLKRNEKVTCDGRIISESGQPPFESFQVDAIIYFDLRNTNDIHRKNLLRNPIEYARWERGVGVMIAAGIPLWFRLMVVQYLRGRPGWVEPIENKPRRIPPHLQARPASNTPQGESSVVSDRQSVQQQEALPQSSISESQGRPELGETGKNPHVKYVKKYIPSESGIAGPQVPHRGGGKDASTARRVSSTGQIQKTSTAKPSGLRHEVLQSLIALTTAQRPGPSTTDSSSNQKRPAAASSQQHPSLQRKDPQPSTQVQSQQVTPRRTQQISSTTQHAKPQSSRLPQKVSLQPTRLASSPPPLELTCLTPINTFATQSSKGGAGTPASTTVASSPVQHSPSRSPLPAKSPGGPPKALLHKASSEPKTPVRAPQSQAMRPGTTPGNMLVNGPSQSPPSPTVGIKRVTKAKPKPTSASTKKQTQK